MNSTSPIHIKDHRDGKQRYVWRQQIYEKDRDVERFLGQHGQGWKIHLNIPADINDTLTKEIMSCLNVHPYVREYKIGYSGDADLYKGATIYAGSWDRVAALGHRLYEVFGYRLPEAKAWPDIRLVGNVAARFDATSIKYRQYGALRGLADLVTCPYDSMWNDPTSFSPAERLAFGKYAIEQYTADFGDYLWGVGGTERFRRQGIAGLPYWAQVWSRGENAPFDIETAVPSRPASAPMPQWLREHKRYE